MSSAIVVVPPDSLPDSAKSTDLNEIRQNLRSNLPVTDPAQSPTVGCGIADGVRSFGDSTILKLFQEHHKI